MTIAADLSWRPALRPDLDLRAPAEEGGPPALWDPLCRREINLGEISSVLVPLLDGRHTLGEILEGAARATGAAPERVEQSLRALLLLNLVAGAGDDIVADLRRARAGGVPLDPVTLPEARFECQASGECCQSYSYGPLADADLARLHALDEEIQRAFPALDGRYLEERRTDKGHVLHFLRAIDDRCVFLQDDHRCGIHARFGVEVKPGLCRDYPLSYVPTARGLRVYDRIECSEFATSCRSGPPIGSDRARIARLLGPDFDFDRDLEHQVVLLGADIPCDYGHFLKLQAALCDLAGAGVGSAARTVAALGRLASDFIRAACECPLSPGEPGRSIQAVLGRDPASSYATADDEQVRRGMAALTEVSAKLLQVVGPRIAVADAVHTPLMTARTARQFAGVVHIVQVLAAERGGLLSGLFDYHERVARLTAADADVEALLRLSFRHQLFGSRALIQRRPLAALQRLAFAYLVTLAGARSSAVNAGRDAIGPADFNFGHTLAMRALRNLDLAAVFLECEDHTWDLVAAAAALF